MKYLAEFINDEIVITESENGIASSKEDAILVLINSYNDRISELQTDIINKNIQIHEDQMTIRDLFYEQRKIISRKKYLKIS